MPACARVVADSRHANPARMMFARSATTACARVIADSRHPDLTRAMFVCGSRVVRAGLRIAAFREVA
jgi:hypothetical protein